MSFNPAALSTGNLVNRPLSQNGAGAVFSIVLDYSGAEVYWEARPGAGVKWQIYRLIGSARDATAFQIQGFIAGTALGKGIDIEVVRGTGAGATVRQTLDSGITSWGELAHNCYDVAFRQGSGAGEYYAHFRWSFDKAGVVVELDGDQDDAIRFVLQENFTGLTAFNIHAQGRVI